MLLVAFWGPHAEGDSSSGEALMVRSFALDLLPERARNILRQIRGTAPASAPVIQRTEPLVQLRNVIIGTTGVCNASCVHCPTNKDETEHLPRAPMPMPLFRRIIDELAEHTAHKGFLSFGLFGDGLVDPFVVERARYVREKLPNAAFCVNSNGAAYNRRKHAELIKWVNLMSLHIESIEPETYDYLMQPLRLKRVLPKVEMMLEDFPGKVYVSVPLSKANYGEKQKIDRYFRDRNAANVVFHGLGNRCSSWKVFSDLALNPVRTYCGKEIGTDLIVDWRGDVFLCCNDFTKKIQIGDISRQTLPEVLNDPRRLAAVELMVQMRHDEIETCRNCYFDKLSPEQRSAAAA